MPKKAKKSIFDSVMTNDVSVDSNNKTVEEKNVESKTTEQIKTLNNVKLNANQQIQNDKPIIYDDVCNKSEELKKMIEDNSNLTDKLSEYITEVENLKSKCKELRNENDNYLMKISTLTFENASLRAKIDELSKNNNYSSVQNQNKNIFSNNHSTNVSYLNQQKQIFSKNNGYSDWN